MNKLGRYFLGLWICFAVGSAVLYFWRGESRFFISAMGILAATIAITALRERLRRKRERYYVYRRGGGEDGLLVYNEEGRIVQLYFSRTNDTIYVPTDSQWKEMMPDWARHRKDEIISRIQKQVGKRLIGKSWSYEKADRKEHLVEQA
jgi:hypothetical protein